MRIFNDTIRQERNLVFIFLIATTLFMSMIILMYPGDQEAVEQVSGLSQMGDWEAAFRIRYGEGGEYRFWLAMLAFSFVAIAYVVIPAQVGTSIITKENDKNTLDLLMGNPVNRRKILYEKIIAMVFLTLISMVYLFLFVLIFSLLIGQNIALEILLAACLQLFIFLVFIGSFGTVFAVYFRDQSRARRYTGSIIVISFLLSFIVLFSEELESLKYLQLFYYNDSGSTLIQPDMKQVSWTNTYYLLFFTLILLTFSFYLNEQKDLVHHYSHKIVKDRKRARGIPILFFYVKGLQKRYPCFVEQLQSDRTIFYIFTGFVTISGLITPGMYPGDKGWEGLIPTYSGNIFIRAMIRDHGVNPGFIGYIATEGLGEFFIYLGILAMILGPKIVLRDQNSNTSDLLFTQPITMKSITLQRFAAVALEYHTLFFFNFMGYTIAILSSGYGEKYILIIGVALYYTCIVTILMTFLLTMVAVFMKQSSKAIAISGFVYFGTFLVFTVCYTIDKIQFLSKLTPFYWGDRIGILYRRYLILEDVLILILYIVLILAISFISASQIKTKEYYGI